MHTVFVPLLRPEWRPGQLPNRGPVCRLLLVCLLASMLLPACKRAYFVSDPYWETVTGISPFQLRRIGLSKGYFVHIVRTTDETLWLRDQQSEQNSASGSSFSLKTRLEELLGQGRKVILSPYWLRNLKEQAAEFPVGSSGQLILIDATAPANERIQSVVSDLAGGYRKMGKIAGSYVLEHPEREQAIAFFYRGSSYDQYLAAFTDGFRSSNPNAESLVTQRYYAAEINDLSMAMEEVEPARNLLILGMAHLSNLAYRRFVAEEQSLFMVENFGSNSDPGQQILLSLDTDHRQLLEAAFALGPPGKGERIETLPYLLTLPNPERLLGLDITGQMAQEALDRRQKQYKRIDRRIARGWERLLKFITDFRFPELPWPDWLRSWF